MTGGAGSPEQSSFWDRLALAFVAFVRALVRLLFILLIAALVGAFVYFGLPRFYSQYVIPVQENTARIADLQARQEEDARRLRERLATLQGRLDELELRRDQDRQTIADLRALLDELASAQEAQTEALERLEEVEAMLIRLEEAVESTLGHVGHVATQVGDNRLRINTLQDEIAAAEAPINRLRRELQLVKAMELITRSRLFLAQNNVGLAEADLRMARDLLASLQSEVLDFQRGALLDIIARLDLALTNIPQNLSLVENDLEVAWQLLVAGLPDEPPLAESGAATGTAPTPPASPTVTPTPGGTQAVTPTPSPTP